MYRFLMGFTWMAIGCIGFFGFTSCNNTPFVQVVSIEDSLAADSAKQAYLAKTGSGPKAPEQLFVTDTNKLYVYLTFDDGPQPGTVNCINICRSETVKSTFFMVGLHQWRKGNGKQIVGMIRNNYPQTMLANHSWDHTMEHYKYFYAHPEMAFANFMRAQDSLQVPNKFIRLPGNRAWVLQNQVRSSKMVRAVCNRLDSAGFNVIGWDLEWNFNHKNARPIQSSEKMAEQVDSAFAKHHEHKRNNLVILSHDRMFQRSEDSASLVKFIQILKRNPHYVFETVDHYPGTKK